jgi:hypothetical protein
METNLNNLTQCPICGGQMAHYRIGGYQCHVQEHNYQRREMNERMIKRWHGDEPENWREIILEEMGITPRRKRER